MIDTVIGYAAESNGIMPVGMDIRGPLALAYAANDYGFGIFDRVYADAGLAGINVWGTTNMDLMIPVGYAIRLVEETVTEKRKTREEYTLDVGGAVLLLGRLSYEYRDTIFKFFTEEVKFSDNLFFGVGLNLGLKFSFRNMFFAGLTLNNFALGYNNPTNNGTRPLFEEGFGVIPPSLTIGLAYTATLSKDSYIYWSFMVDYRDMINLNKYDTRNPILNLGVGTELSFLRIFSISFGINDMLPALGFGLNLQLLRADFALYGKELSNEPGVSSVFTFDFSLSFQIPIEEKRPKTPRRPPAQQK
jgi:hypothetical protein